jgi:hypothetical protein
MLFEDFSAKAEREDIFKLTHENETLYEMSNDNGVIVLLLNFAISDSLIVGDTMFPHCDIREHTSTSPDGRTYRLITSW